MDVADEVKTEAEVNAAIEDTKKQVTDVESELTDTVGFAESTKTLAETAQKPGEGTENEAAEYTEVAKENIIDPITASETGTTEDKVFLDHSSLKLKNGENFVLKAAVSPEGNAGTWGSSNEGIAAVQDGVVTAVAVGTADIMVTTAAGNQAVCNVTVLEQEAPGITIDISQPSVRVNVGQSIQIGAEVKGSGVRRLLYRR